MENDRMKTVKWGVKEKLKGITPRIKSYCRNHNLDITPDIDVVFSPVGHDHHQWRQHKQLPITDKCIQCTVRGKGNNLTRSGRIKIRSEFIALFEHYDLKYVFILSDRKNLGMMKNEKRGEGKC